MSTLTKEVVKQTKSTLNFESSEIDYYSLTKLEDLGLVNLDKLPQDFPALRSFAL